MPPRYACPGTGTSQSIWPFAVPNRCPRLTLLRGAALTGMALWRGMPFAKLFRSRWAALLWAGGILWTAVDVVGVGAPAHQQAAANTAEPVDVTGTPVSNDDLNTLAHFGGAEDGQAGGR